MDNTNDYQEIDQAFEDKVKHAVSLNEREQLRSFIDDLEASYQSERTDTAVVRSISWKRWMNIAAAILLVVAAVFTFRSINGPSGDQIVADYYEPYPNAYKPITRSQPQEVDVELKGLLAYESERYAEALDFFNQIPDANDHIRIFKAISNIELGSLELAKTDLTYLIENNDRLQRPANWYMGLIYLKEGMFDQAKTHFEYLANQPADSAYQRDASDILNRI